MIRWYWIAVVALVIYWYATNREQNLVTQAAADRYREGKHPLEDPAVSPPAVDMAVAIEAAAAMQPPPTTRLDLPRSAYVIADIGVQGRGLSGGAASDLIPHSARVVIA